MVYINYVVIELMEEIDETDVFFYAIIHVTNCSIITEKTATFEWYGKTFNGIISFDGNFFLKFIF